MAKKELTKKRIITTAFTEWGKKGFKTTSLTLITNKLKITKPALYRYFKNKNEIIYEMQNVILDNILNQTTKFINQCSGMQIDELIFLYIEKNFTYFINNTYHFLFYLFYILRTDIGKNEKVLIFREKLGNIFHSAFKQSNSWLKHDNTGIALDLIYTTAIFYLICHIKTVNINKKIIHPLDGKEKDTILNNIYTIITNGFGGNFSRRALDFSSIEKNVSMKPEDIGDHNKILDAIACVVAEEGLWGASVSKIATKLNMSKSSLYFYFDNKNDMLENMINNEIEKNNRFIVQKSQGYETFEQKLYCIIAATASYFMNNRNMIYVFDYLHYQRLSINDLKMHNKITFTYDIILKHALEDGLINDHGYDLDFILGFLNMQIVKDFFISGINSETIVIENMRNIYKYFLYGLLNNDTG